ADRDAEPMLLPWNPGLSLGQNLTNLFYNRDGFELAMDAAGIADPTGLVDLSASLYYIARGDALNAGISLASILPFGDVLKAGRVGARMAGAAKTGTSVIKGFTKHSANQAVQRGF